MTHEPVRTVPKRGGVKKADRDRIGERDGWICCFCGGSVDKDHVWQKSVMPAPELVAQAAAILSEGVDERITAWTGTDIGRVLAAFSAWPKNPHREPYVEASRSAQELRRELSELRYPNSCDKVRKAELTPLIEEAEETCKALSAQAIDRYERHRPHYEVLEAVRAVYRQRNRDRPSVEHRVPVIAGGTNSKENLAIAHLECNLKRGGNSLLVANLMIANHKGIPLEGRAACWKTGSAVETSSSSGGWKRRGGGENGRGDSSCSGLSTRSCGGSFAASVTGCAGRWTRRSVADPEPARQDRSQARAVAVRHRSREA